MSDPVLFMAAAFAQGQFVPPPVPVPPTPALPMTPADEVRSRPLTPPLQANTYPEAAPALPRISRFRPADLPRLDLTNGYAHNSAYNSPALASPARPAPDPTAVAAPAVSPRSNTELYYQRLAALQAGKLYTRLPTDSFAAAWQGATRKPTYAQWRRLLAAEARSVAAGQGNNRLAVLVGDSLSLWYPSDRLPQKQLWLNQSISGETTRGILNRLADFAAPRTHTIYLLAGVNDLKQGFSDAEILGNLRAIMVRLRRYHPQAQIIVQSILPTQSPLIPNQRIAGLNQQLAAIAQQTDVTFLNLHPQFADASDHLRTELTTDGIHLSALGYATWQTVLQQVTLLARR